MNLSLIWDKKLWRNFATTSVFSVFLFPYQKFSETPKEFPKKLFASVRPKTFDGRTWYPLSIQEMFSLPEFSEKWNRTQRKLSVMWDKKNQPKNLISPSLIHTNFSLPQSFWNNEEFPMKDFEALIQKNCDRKTWYPTASSMQNSRYQIFCEIPMCSQFTFSVKGDKNCLTENCTTPVLFIFFFPYQKVSETTKISQWFSPVLWFKKFRRKTWYPLLSSIQTFRFDIFLETLKSSQWKFSVSWVEQNRPENVISPLTSIQIFRYRIFLETLKSSQWTFLVLWDEKNWRENVISPVASLSNFAARSFLKQRRDPKENFRNSDAENLRQKNVISPSLIHAIFPLPELLWNTEVFPMHFLGKRRQNIFDGNLHYPRLVHIFILITESFWNHEDFSMNFSGTVIQNISTEKRDIPFSHPYQLFAARKLWKQRRVPRKSLRKVRLEKTTAKRDIPFRIQKTFSLPEISWNNEEFSMNLSVNWYKKMWWNFATTSVFSTFLFPYQKYSETPKEYPNKVFANVRPKNFVRKLWYPPRIQETFRLAEVLRNNEKSPRKVFGNVRQKESTEKPDIPLSHPYKFFAARVFLEHRRIPNERFR